MQQLSSFGARLVITVLATATVAFTAFVGLTFFRLERGLERQAEQLGRLSELKLAERLTSGNRLAQARLEMLFADVQRQLANIAQRADVVDAVSSRNVVAMSEVLGRAARTADIDGILVVDARAHVIGKSGGKLGLLATSEAFQNSWIAGEVRQIASENDPTDRRGFRRIIELDGQMSAAVGAKSTAALAGISVEPVFDEFGDVFAALIAHRALRSGEAILAELSKLEGAGLLVQAGNKVISSAGLTAPIAAGPEASGTQLFAAEDGKHWARCAALFENWRICALAPKSELDVLRDEMVRVGEMEAGSLVKWLFLVATLSLVSCGLITFLAARHITGPIAKITEAVRAVSRGDWKSEVTAVHRKDEIGDIARAVVVLQRSMEERDRLRSDAAEAESLNQRRASLEEAIKRFDRSMRSVLLSVTDSIETMDETSRELSRISAAAEGEADEAAFVSENTTRNAAQVRSAFEDLTESISQTAPLIREATRVIESSKQTTENVASDFEKLVGESKAVHELVRIAEQNLQEAGLLAIGAKFDGDDERSDRQRVEEVTRNVAELARRISDANAELRTKASNMEIATTEALETIAGIAGKLEEVLRRAESIGSAMAEQGASAQAIGEGLSSAATSGANVSASVERLKSTVAEARSVSSNVFSKATDVADDARRLDTTMRDFLLELSQAKAEQTTVPPVSATG